MISWGIKSISIQASHDYKPLHLLYFSCLVSLQNTCRRCQLPVGRGGVLWGITRKDGMMPRWSPTDYLHGAAAVFWEVFEASAKTVVDNNVNRDNSQCDFAIFIFNLKAAALMKYYSLSLRFVRSSNILQLTAHFWCFFLNFFYFPGLWTGVHQPQEGGSGRREPRRVSDPGVGLQGGLLRTKGPGTAERPPPGAQPRLQHAVWERPAEHPLPRDERRKSALCFKGFNELP